MGYAWKRGRSVGQRKRKKKRKPHVRWEHVFSLMLEPLSRVERKREREGLSTPLDEVKINSCSQRRNSIYRERGWFFSFPLFLFFLINRSDLFRFSVCFHCSSLTRRLSSTRKTREIPVFSGTMPPLFNFFRYKIFTVATRNDVTVV